MNKSKKIFLGTILFALVVAIGIFINLNQTGEFWDITNTDDGFVSEQPSIIPKVSEDDIPPQDTISISGVSMNNFIIDRGLENEHGDVLVLNENGYLINYNIRTQSFQISILDRPFFLKRIQAENAFISEMEITRQQACELDITISTPRFINPDEAGNVYPLSFCP